MGYTDVIKKITEIENSDFTMDSLKNIGFIARDINHIYDIDLMNNKMDAKTNFIEIRGKLNSVVFDKLKEKLGFEDEVIDEIIDFMDYFQYISDIYVLDGNVIIKLLSDNNGKEVSYLVSKGFYDIISKKFVDNSNFYKDFFVNSINQVMAPLFKEKLEKGQLLKVKNNEIYYNLNNLNIYINKPLNEIMKTNTDADYQIAKVLIKHNNDELYYYDMKIHNNYFELLQNDYKINKLSEMLTKKNKIKTLKNG